MKLFVFALVCASIGIAGCAGQKNGSVVNAENANDNSNDNGTVSAKVIYGVDDRIDLYNETNPDWLNRANSTVALMSSSDLKLNGNSYSIAGTKYGTSQGLCKNEPFYDQSTAAFCSGSLIAPDIIMTAGHCVRNLASCQANKYVFNFAYKSKNVAPTKVDLDDVYSCKELIYTELNNSTSNDFALIRLDRPVVGRDPLPVRQKGQVMVGDNLTVIGYPSGLPLKIAPGAKVRDASPLNFFVTNLDTYGGNSGSAVFNSDTGVIEGILVRGATDFVYKNGCYVSNVCAADGCRGEDVTRVASILKYVDKSELARLPEEFEEEEVLPVPEIELPSEEIVEPEVAAEPVPSVFPIEVL